jgi:hypothetical protein
VLSTTLFITYRGTAGLSFERGAAVGFLFLSSRRGKFSVAMDISGKYNSQLKQL